MPEEFEKKITNLKIARNNLLTFHKILIDREKSELERVTGSVTAGQFLNLLLNDERFEWLRTISRLVVKIDEAFELNDGITPEIVEEYQSEMIAMFDASEANVEFKRLIDKRLLHLPEAERLRSEITRLLE